MTFLASIEYIQGGPNSTTGASGGGSSIDTTGATAILAVIRSNASATPSIKDSQSNVWNVSSIFSVGQTAVALAWVFGPTTSTTHTFDTIAHEGSGDVFAFSGSGAWSVGNLAGYTSPTSGSTVVTNSITVSTGDVVLAGITSNSSLSTGTISNGFSGGISGSPTDVALPQELSGSPEAGMGGYLFAVSGGSLDATFTTSASNTDWGWVIGNFSLATGFSISGNAGVASATVAYTGTSSGSVTADGAGNYTISGLSNGSYTVTPSLAGYTFSPTNQSVTISGSNVTGVNFTATPVTTGARAVFLIL